jgi:hypothetical protein
MVDGHDLVYAGKTKVIQEAPVLKYERLEPSPSETATPGEYEYEVVVVNPAFVLKDGVKNEQLYGDDR